MGKLRSDEIQTKLVVVMVKRDITMHLPIEVPIFEVPVLEAVHPEAEIEIRKVVRDVVLNIPAELERMNAKYGFNSEVKQSYVEQAFGRGAINLRSVSSELVDGLEINELDSNTDETQTEIDDVLTLREKLTKAGIPFHPRAGAAKLKSLLESAEPASAAG